MMYEEELQEEHDLIRKILKGQEPLSMAEMETVSYNMKLRDVYSDRWWRPDLPFYFVHMDTAITNQARAGQQLYYQYGKRSDDFLVENYGFCLDYGQNPFSCWKFRVIIGS